MNLEIAQTFEETYGGITYKVNVTDEVLNFVENVDFESESVETLFDSSCTILDNVHKRSNIIPNIAECSLYYNDGSLSIYINELDESFIMAIMPCGDNQKYRFVAVTDIL